MDGYTAVCGTTTLLQLLYVPLQTAAHTCRVPVLLFCSLGALSYGCLGREPQQAQRARHRRDASDRAWSFSPSRQAAVMTNAWTRVGSVGWRASTSHFTRHVKTREEQQTSSVKLPRSLQQYLRISVPARHHRLLRAVLPPLKSCYCCCYCVTRYMRAVLSFQRTIPSLACRAAVLSDPFVFVDRVARRESNQKKLLIATPWKGCYVADLVRFFYSSMYANAAAAGGGRRWNESV